MVDEKGLTDVGIALMLVGGVLFAFSAIAGAVMIGVGLGLAPVAILVTGIVLTGIGVYERLRQ